MGIENALVDCEMAEEGMLEDLRKISAQVKQIPAGKMSAQMKNLLTKSRAKRRALHSMQGQKQHLQRQQEALASCELNEKVINTMKTTSGLLKDIGMESQLALVDETMMDMQENMQNANSITSALAFDNEDNNDDELSEELRVLMDDDWDKAIGDVQRTAITTAPIAVNDTKKDGPLAVSVSTKAPEPLIRGEGELLTPQTVAQTVDT